MATRKQARVKETPPPEPTIKDELRALKVDRILQVAAKLFIERGFVGTTMEAIADQMSMTKPFIYQFFPNKHALLAAICDRELRDSLSMLNAPLTDDGPPEQRLVNFVRIATLRNIENRGLWSLMSVEEKHLPKEMLSDIRALEMQFHKRLTAIIEAGAKSGAFVAAHPELASRAVMGMTQWVRRWYKGTADTSPQDVADELCVLSLRMLGYQENAAL